MWYTRDREKRQLYGESFKIALLQIKHKRIKPSEGNYSNRTHYMGFSSLKECFSYIISLKLKNEFALRA